MGAVGGEDLSEITRNLPRWSFIRVESRVRRIGSQRDESSQLTYRGRILKLAPRLLHSQSGTLQGCLKWSSEAVSEVSQLQQLQYAQVASNFKLQNNKLQAKGDVRSPDRTRQSWA